MNGRRNFVLALFAALGRRTVKAAPAPKEQVGRTFMQVTRYDRMPDKFFKPYFAATDENYTPAMLKAPGLLSYQRFTHYDLPEKIEIQVWESEQAAKAWHDSEKAKALFQRATKQFQSSLSPEYLQAMHSFAHYHYILEKSFKA